VNYETTWYRSNHAAYDRVHDHSMGAVAQSRGARWPSRPQGNRSGTRISSWLTDPKLNGGGALFDFGCYGADLSTWLMDGRRPDTVTALTQQIKPDVYPHVDDERRSS